MSIRILSSEVSSFQYKSIYSTAYSELCSTKRRFLKKYLKMPFRRMPDNYKRDLAAYSALVSAILEQCAEDLVWAYLFDLSTTVRATTALPLRGARAADCLLNASSKLHSVHGISHNDLKTIAGVAQFTLACSTVQINAFYQLGKLRGQAVHTFAVAVRDPADVWADTKDIFAVIRDLAIFCSATAHGFRLMR